MGVGVGRYPFLRSQKIFLFFDLEIAYFGAINNVSIIIKYFNKKAYLTPGKRATAVCVYLTPPSWGTPCDINAIYTLQKSTFSGLQFRRWQYGSIFIHLAVIASETREMWQNSKKIWPYSSWRSSKVIVIDLGVDGKPICDFILVINCNFSRICYRFQDIHA